MRRSFPLPHEGSHMLLLLTSFIIYFGYSVPNEGRLKHLGLSPIQILSLFPIVGFFLDPLLLHLGPGGHLPFISGCF
jgi:hypothetical protein